MTLRLTLPRTSVDVAAGQSVLLDVHATNTGPSACRVRLEVTGRAAAWVRLTAESPGQPLRRDGADGLDLAAGASATLSLLVSPPRAGGRADQMVPFTVRAVDRDTGEPSASATGLVVVRSPATVTGTLAPESVVGRRGSRHVLHLTSDDAAGALVTLRGTAPDHRTRVTVQPVALRVEAGRPAQVEVTVETGASLLRRRRHDFEVGWETEGPDGAVHGGTTGTLEQQPLLAPIPAVLLAVAVLVALSLAAWQVWPLTAERRQPSSAAAGVGETVAPSSVPARPFAIVGVRVKAPDPAESLQAAQESAGTTPVGSGQRSRVIDGADDPDLNDEFWLIVVEGFDDLAQAQAYCADKPPLDCSVVE